MSRIFTKTILVLLAAVLLSCGGGGGGSTVSEGGIGGTGISVGPITGFGSIFVNGIEFDTSTAAIQVDGQEVGEGDAASLSHLAVGQIVTVEGRFDSTGSTGTATRVSFNDDIEGPVQSITVVDSTTRQLMVLGQTVIIDDQTNLVNLTLASLAVSNVLEISGQENSNGELVATYVKKISDTEAVGSIYDVNGTVSLLDTGLQRFTLNNLIVDYSSADLSGLTASLANGQAVEVKGVLSGSTLTATLVKSDEQVSAADGTRMEVEGYISQVASATRFVVNGQTVATASSTQYTSGTAQDIATNVLVEVEGILSGGVLMAEHVTFASPVNAESRVAAVGSNTLTLLGLPGLTVTSNSLTEVDGKTTNFSGIMSNDFLHVRGRAVGSTFVATKIEVENPSIPSEVIFQGPVASLTAPTITVLGVTIDTTGLAFRDINGDSVSAAGFFASVGVNDIVRFKGSLDGSANMTWQSVTLEVNN